ncbi:MAG: cyclopropane-fatty-acyl-phospholipid synthase family protein, partial [Planctomycetota bacterium]
LRLDVGAIRIRDADAVHSFGDAGAQAPCDIYVSDPRFYRYLLWGGSLGAGDAYVRGCWHGGDLLPLMRLLARNSDAIAGVDSAWSLISSAGGKLVRLAHLNTRRGSRRNIRAHYDLSNEFFAEFLDPTMTYSCGLFATPETTLEQASLAKYERACRQLQLDPGDHVLEIGCGWGGFAEYASRRYGCRVTGVTISQRQFEYARRRIDVAGLSDRVEIRLCDYRDLEGRFDKAVSIEMIEAVGHEFLSQFFSKCCSLLRPDGLMFLQAITIPDRRYDRYRHSTDFIQKYIFPGGCLPSLGALSGALRPTDFTIVDQRDFAADYARTLVHWRRRFLAAASRVRQQGFDDRFLRMWDYYLCYCAAGFFQRQIGLSQLVLAREQACWESPARRKRYRESGSSQYCD